MKSIYFDIDKLFSFNATMYLVIGERGVGKTFASICALIKDFLKNGHQFVYVRRYQTELDKACPKFFDDIVAKNVFPDHEFKVVTSEQYGTIFYIDGQEAGFAKSLTTASNEKSIPFPKVRTLLFDEFTITRSSHRHYLPDEITAFLDLCETIFRLRDMRILMLGNATSINNPYMNEWNLTLPYDSEYRVFRDGQIVVNYVKNEPYREAKRKSKLGKLIAGLRYDDYATNNKFLQDSSSFVGNRPSYASYYFSLNMDSKIYGIWIDKDGYMYVSGSHDPNCKLTAAFNIKDHNETTILQSKTSPAVKNILAHYDTGHLVFESTLIKAIFYDNLLRFAH